MDNRAKWKVVVSSVLCVAFAWSASGHTLECTLGSADVLPGEPILLKVLVTPEKDAASSGASQSAEEAVDLVIKNLCFVLERDGAVVGKLPLVPQTLATKKAGGLTREFQYVVPLMVFDRPSRDLRYVTDAGSYEIRVCDCSQPSQVSSDPISVQLSEMSSDERRAFEAYQRIPVRAMLLGLWEHEGTEETLAQLRKVTREFGNTTYGAYADSALALCEFSEAGHTNRSNERDAKYEELENKCKHLESRFSSQHPLREELFWTRILIEARLGHLEAARTSLSQFKSEYPNSRKQADAARLAQELEKEDKEGSP